MDRRLAGLMLVLLTIVGVTVTAAPDHRLAGTAVIAPFPPPPATTACLLGSTDDVPGEAPAARSPNPTSPQFGSCTDPRAIGEVVSVRRGTGAVAQAMRSTDCRAEVLEHAGLVPRDGGFVLPDEPASGIVHWQYSVPVSSFWTSQIPWSPEASGWAACIARPTHASDPHRPTPLAGAFAGRERLPGDYGTCWQSTRVDTSMSMVTCDRPHVSELIAVGRIEDIRTVVWEQVLASCADQAARATRRTDPTAGGQLAVHVRPDGSVLTYRIRSLTCFVSSADDRLMLGSLIGGGPTPVRFAR